MVDLSAKPYGLSSNQIDEVKKIVAGMSEQDKLDQLLCPLAFGFDPGMLRGLLSQHRFGGLMFRPGTLEEVSLACNTVQEMSPIPAFTAANLEDGGSGAIADKGTPLGRQMLISATGNTDSAYKLGTVCGREGSAAGLNWAFSPVIDIDNNFRNPITNVRTYGSNPDKVLAMGEAYMKGAMENGVICSIKHFPGDGIDDRDQHLVTSVNSLSIEEWEASYGKVYRSLIEKGAPTVMVGHIAMPAMEEFYDKAPCKKVINASQSKNVLRYLKEEVGFNGLIITDASPMVGFMACESRRIAVPSCIENGCDMLLFNKNLDEDIIYMREGLHNGLLSQERLEEACMKIIATKMVMGLFADKASGAIIKNEENFKAIGTEEHVAWAKEVADSGITLVKDKLGVLPLSPNKTKKILLEIIGDFDSNDRVREHFMKLLEKDGFDVTLYVPENVNDIFNDKGIEAFKEKYDLVLYIGNIENASNKTVARINWHTLFGAGNNLPWFASELPTLFISVGNPYHLYDVPMISTYVNCYCNYPMVIDAAWDKVMGRSEFVGISPVDAFCGTFGTDL